MRFSVITPTHDACHLTQTWQSLRAQSFGDWEWVVLANGPEGPVVHALAAEIRNIVDSDPRVRVVEHVSPYVGIGQRKAAAFAAGRGEILVELDHDDLLVSTALARLHQVFCDDEVGFAYSDSVDFPDDGKSPVTYHDPGRRQMWREAWLQFEQRTVFWPGAERRECLVPVTFEATALSFAHVYTAPNHVRAWRASVYRELGGHDPGLPVCDDHDLVVRTYLHSRVAHVPHALYCYRVKQDNSNTWLQQTEEIARRTVEIRSKYLERLVLREAELLGLPCYDLGGGIDCRPGFRAVDYRFVENQRVGDVQADLRERWPFPDSSVAAFRAADFLEHLPDKMHTMSEIHRCLRPGGWLLSSTPSTDGRGAHMDPTHVSYWNSPAFWYWTRRQQARYIRNETVRFLEVELSDGFPSDWHRVHNIPYVTANLVCLKGDYRGPGTVQI